MRMQSAERRIRASRPVARPAPDWSIERLRKHFGMIPAERILLDPPPGTARPADVFFMDDQRNRLCELVDGVLLEKPMGAKESVLAAALIFAIQLYQRRRKLGVVLGEAGFLQLVPGLVRAPDVAFIPWERLPDGVFPDEPVPLLVPALAVEILSKTNTRLEIARKLKEYFASGVRLVWVVQPRQQVIEAYTSVKDVRRLTVGQVLDGGGVLPGFKLPLKQFFAPIQWRGKK